MIKKLKIVFSFILVFNILFTSTVVYAAPNVSESSIKELSDSYSSLLKDYKTLNTRRTLTREELKTLKEYRSYDEIPVYFYCNNPDYLVDFNDYSPVRLIVDLLNKQLDLNLKFEVVFVENNSEFMDQLKSRQSDDLCIDIVSSNNITLLNESYPDISISLPLLSENLYFVSRIGSLNEPIRTGDILSYDKSIYAIQTDIDSNLKTKDLDILEANNALVDGTTRYYLTPSYNLPTATYNSTLMYRYSTASYILPNVLSTIYGFGANKKYENLISIINKFITNEFTETVETQSYIYNNFIREYAFYNSLTGIEVDYLQNNDVLKVYFNESYNLMENTDGDIRGFIPDIINRVCDLTYLTPEYIDTSGIYQTDDTSENIEEESNFNISSIYTQDVAETLVSTFDDNERENMYSSNQHRFSHPMEIIKYYTTADLESINQLKFANIGTLSSFSLNAGWFMSKYNLGVTRLEVYNTEEALLDALKLGLIDYAVVPPGNVAHYSSNTDYNISTAYINQPFNLDNYINWTLILQDPEEISALSTIFSKAVATLDYDKLIDHWFPPKTEYLMYNKINSLNKKLVITLLLLSVITFSVVSQVSKNRKSNVQRVYDANTIDSATGLKNDHAFTSDKDFIKNGYLVICQITKYNRANQIYGIDRTDKLISSYANILVKIYGEPFVYRVSVDTFYVLIPDPRNIINLQDALNILHDSLDKGISTGSNIVKLKWSIVGGSYSMFDDVDTFIKFTEEFSSDAMTDPNLNCSILDPKEYSNILYKNHIYDVLRNITPEHVFPFYQPFVDAKTYKVKGCEVLARLKVNDEIIPAYKFIHLAERIGTLCDIDKMILEKTIALRADLLLKGVINSNFYFSVNFSAQFLRTLNSEYLYGLSKRYGVKSFSFLQIEILEEELTDQEVEKIKHIIREFDLKTAIDDFSTGYSTISRLKNFNFDVIKMDKGLLPINFTLLDREIYKSLVNMIVDFSESIVVEGVETVEHVEFLRTISVDTLQGFYFAKPMAREDFVSYILNTNVY